MVMYQSVQKGLSHGKIAKASGRLSAPIVRSDGCGLDVKQPSINARYGSFMRGVMDFQHADPRKTDTEVHLAADRRRPGRRMVHSPELLPLLRGQSEVELPVGSETGCGLN